MAHKISSNGKVEVLDITSFLWHARCLAALARPFVRLGRTIYAIISWRYPKLSFVIWLLINTATVIVPAGYNLVIFVLMLASVTALGLLHHNTRIFIKFFPGSELEANALQTYLQRSWGDEQKILQEYRKVLVQIDGIMATTNAALERFYNVLKWENQTLSTSVVVTLGIGATFLYLADLSIAIFAVNNFVLLGSGLYWCRCDRVNSTEIIAESSRTGESKVNLDPDLESDDVKLESDVDDILLEEDEDRYSMELARAKLAEESCSTAGKYRTNVVRKIMDLRRRPQQGGTCTGCQAAFISILKRKYICCNCGNGFCSRCCSLKVPKSFLGVTAPTTKNDTVLLCGVCYCHLSTKKSS